MGGQGGAEHERQQSNADLLRLNPPIGLRAAEVVVTYTRGLACRRCRPASRLGSSVLAGVPEWRQRRPARVGLRGWEANLPHMEASMRSHDQTLLARLGFSDPDKKDPRHDMACRYLSQPEQVLAMARLLGMPKLPDVGAEQVVRCNSDGWASPDGTSELRVRVAEHRTKADGHVEAPVSKGEGRYKVTVGFLDVLGTWELAARYHGWLVTPEIKTIPRWRHRKTGEITEDQKAARDAE